MLVLESGARFAELGVEVQRQGRGPDRYIHKYMENNDESK